LDRKRFSDRKIEFSEIIKRKSEKLLRSKITYILARLLLGGIFVFASIPKVLSPLGFSQIIYNYKILPDFLIYITASILPWIEFFCGIFLLIGVFIRSSAIILSSLLYIFILIILINMLRDINFDCGCFSLTSNGNNLNGFVLIIRDLFILFPGLILIFHNHK